MNENPRAWRVITHRDTSDSDVQAIQAYELALHAYRTALDQVRTSQALSAELRDPSGRPVLDSHYDSGPLEPLDDGLLNAPSGRYRYIDTDTPGASDLGRFHRLL
jgi:hypothetical protein